jgi:hypothetical protein
MNDATKVGARFAQEIASRGNEDLDIEKLVDRFLSLDPAARRAAIEELSGHADTKVRGIGAALRHVTDGFEPRGAEVKRTIEVQSEKPAGPKIKRD